MAIVPFKLWEDMNRWKKSKFKNLVCLQIRMSQQQPVVKEIYLRSGPTKIYRKQKNLSCMAKLYTNLKQLTKKLWNNNHLSFSPLWQRRHPLIRKSINWLWIACLKCLNAKLNFYFPSYKIIPACPGMMMVLSNSMANLFRDLTLSIWWMMWWDKGKEVSLWEGNRLQKG